MDKYLYHGSSLSDIQILETRSKLHHTHQKVVYLTDNIPYALVYIWDEKKYHQKWVTCGFQNHLAVYEALLSYEKKGLFVLQRFNEASIKKQNELTDRIASLIIQENLLEKNNEDSHFFKPTSKPPGRLPKIKNRHHHDDRFILFIFLL